MFLLPHWFTNTYRKATHFSLLVISDRVFKKVLTLLFSYIISSFLVIMMFVSESLFSRFILQFISLNLFPLVRLSTAWLMMENDTRRFLHTISIVFNGLCKPLSLYCLGIYCYVIRFGSVYHWGYIVTHCHSWVITLKIVLFWIQRLLQSHLRLDFIRNYCIL